MAGHIARALKAAGDPPRGVIVAVRGQIAPMEQMFNGLTLGLALAVIVILLLLTGYFQSLRLAIIVTTTVPAVLCGVILMLLLTGTTLNIQSFMGAIMAIGVAVANAILLLTFAERSRHGGVDSVTAAVEGARLRLRPILMTSLAMLAGMVPWPWLSARAASRIAAGRSRDRQVVGRDGCHALYPPQRVRSRSGARSPRCRCHPHDPLALFPLTSRGRVT